MGRRPHGPRAASSTCDLVRTRHSGSVGPGIQAPSRPTRSAGREHEITDDPVGPGLRGPPEGMATTFKRTGGSLRTRRRPGEVERTVRSTSAERMAVWTLRLPPEPLKTADSTRLTRDIAEPGRQHCASDAPAHGVRRRRLRFGGFFARRFDGLLAHTAMVRTNWLVRPLASGTLCRTTAGRDERLGRERRPSRNGRPSARSESRRVSASCQRLRRRWHGLHDRTRTEPWHRVGQHARRGCGAKTGVTVEQRFPSPRDQSTRWNRISRPSAQA